jgi:hypothetical protein
VPISLLFGNTPVIPHVDQVPVTQAARLGDIHTAKAEYKQLLAERRVETSLRKKPSTAVDYVFDRGDWVYVYLSEYPTSNRCDEHDGRINVIRVNCTVAGVPCIGG